ncbi:MAG: motility associated factor glycosyltransferase family protein [Clostridium sp.]
MKRIKTIDGYETYKITKDEKLYFLSNTLSYRYNIRKIEKEIDDLKFDSLIIIFGGDTLSYIDDIFKLCTPYNRILIIEPNIEVYNEIIKINKQNLAVLFYEEELLPKQLGAIINPNNFNNLYVFPFGNYKEIYEEEYKYFIEVIDHQYYNCSALINLSYRFKDIFIKNLSRNINIVNKTTPINEYENLQKNLPAFIISAGPSLNKNLEVMSKNKDKLKNSIIIAGTRTLKALLNVGIKPDLIVSVDPIDDNYEMIKDHLNENIPLVFYEYSNSKIINEYKGEKIYLSNLLSMVLEELKNLKGCYLGGSVAHTCVDIGRTLGCTNIILVGQDLAFTNGEHHSSKATFEFDDPKNYSAQLKDKDVYGNEVYTNRTLYEFKLNLEEYIVKDLLVSKDVNYYNGSFGANIKNAPHMDLESIFTLDIFNWEKKEFKRNYTVNLNPENVMMDIERFLSKNIKKGKEILSNLERISKCDPSIEMVKLDEGDERIVKFNEALEFITEFETSKEKYYLSAYFTKFDFEVKQLKFSMMAKDYQKLTSNLKYQSTCFIFYFKEVVKMLEKVKLLMEE